MAKSEKKRLEYTVLELHVINWATDRIDELRDMSLDMEEVEMSIEEEKVVCSSIAFELFRLMELLKPLRYFEDSLFDWATEFLEEHYDKNFECPPLWAVN